MTTARDNGMADKLVSLTNKQFEKYCTLVYDVCGINLNEEKRALLNARIAKRLRLQGVSPDVYYKMIRQDAAELARFIDAVTTNHTFFFRESSSFKYIRADFDNIWCAASSSGEEPYSLATHALSLGGSPQILATDISDTSLEKARLGIYPDNCVQKIPQPLLKAYFQKGKNRWVGMVRVKPRVKSMVEFRKFNLLKDPVPNTRFDMIFCRNVMIYFDAPTKEHVVERLVRTLKPGGYFVIGGAESLSGLRHTLRYVEPSVYQK